MLPKASVSVTLIHALIMYAANIGIDVNEACQKTGLQSVLLDDLEARVPAQQFHSLWLEITHQSRDPNFGLHFAELTRHQPGEGVLAAMMANCPTVGSAMEKLMRYHALSTDVIQVRFRQEAGRATFAWESVPVNDPLDRQIGEAVISRLFFTLENISRDKIRPIVINFRHPRPESISEHQRIFGCPLAFDQPIDEIVIQADGLNLPILMANPKLLEPLEAIVQNLLDQLYPPDTWADQVTHRISNLLLDGQKPTISLIAQEMAVSTRYLQKKLKSEGVTYQRLLAQVREKMALGYLKEPNMSYFDTAFLLGFSDQSAFNHAFKRWTGMTPKEFRRKQN
jgi:AraC-like DNA-binding protein